MPGIYGLINKGTCYHKKIGIENSNIFRAMTNSMQYESFYHTRQYHDSDLGVYVGWVGLTDSPMNIKPIINRKDGLSLFVSGLIHCEKEIKVEIPQGTSQVVKEYYTIVDKYYNIGEDFLDSVNGLFSGFLIDNHRKKCILFNDPMGIERLFLHEDSERFVFSSEAKAILAGFTETRSFDSIGLSQFLTCGCTLGNKSLFRKIWVLPAGSVVKFVKGKQYQISSYFSKSKWEALEPLPERDFTHLFSETLKGILKRYLIKPSSFGISLTGGLDSRMIMASLKSLEATIPCYTFSSMYRETYDVIVARKIAQLYHYPYKKLVLGRQFLENFENILTKAVVISDGYLGFSGAAELYLNSLARDVAPIRVTGNYGGELLRGIRTFGSSILKGNFLKHDLLLLMEEIIRVFSRMNQMMPVSFTLFIQAPSGYGRYAIERSQVTTISPFLDRDLVELIYRKPISIGTNENISIDLIRQGDPDLLEISTDRGLLGRGGWVSKTYCRMIRETVFKLEYLFGYGTPNILTMISRFGIGHIGERLFNGRHKFQHFKTWIKREIADYICDLLISRNFHTDLDEYIDFFRVKEMLLKHINSKRNYTKEIDIIATLVLTERLLFRH